MPLKKWTERKDDFWRERKKVNADKLQRKKTKTKTKTQRQIKNEKKKKSFGHITKRFSKFAADCGELQSLFIFKFGLIFLKMLFIIIMSTKEVSGVSGFDIFFLFFGCVFYFHFFFPLSHSNGKEMTIYKLYWRLMYVCTHSDSNEWKWR